MQRGGRAGRPPGPGRKALVRHAGRGGRPRPGRPGAPRPRPPFTRIEQVLVDGRPIPHVSGVVLPAGRETLEIRYTAPVFRFPERARFRYGLAGFDDHPVEAGPRRTAIYTNLAPGTYEFTVAGSAPTGQPFGPPSVPLAVRVEPRLYQT